MATSSAAIGTDAPGIARRRFGGDEVAYLVVLVFALSIIVVTIAIVWQLWLHSSPARQKFGFSFLSSKLGTPSPTSSGHGRSYTALSLHRFWHS